MSGVKSTEAPLETTVSQLSETKAKSPPRHTLIVRVTHWVITFCFVVLVITGGEIVISHPRFYWGETGTVLTEPLFKIPIPSSRRLVPSGYSYVMPDQNGWSRALHFEMAWVVVFTGLLYFASGIRSGHFSRNLIPHRKDLSWRGISSVVVHHLGIKRQDDAGSYNVMQRLTYLCVIFFLFPLVIWTGLAMSPAFDSAIPATVNLLGGRQSARTIHFFVSIALLMFFFVHVILVWRAGFVCRIRAMITGEAKERKHD